MQLELAVTPTRAPTPVGASTYNGKMVCFGQTDTYSYFQTGMAMTGTLRWGEVVEQVSGTAGAHRPAVVSEIRRRRRNRGRPARPVARMAHDQFRQRRRPEHLAPVRPHERQCAATVYRRRRVSYPDPAPAAGVRRRRRRRGQQLREMAELDPAAGAPARCRPVHGRSSPDHLRHTATGRRRRAAGAGAGARPADRIHGGPYRYRGTLRGEPVSGFAFNERSLALYRDWELVEVLATTVASIDRRSGSADRGGSAGAVGGRGPSREARSC